MIKEYTINVFNINKSLLSSGDIPYEKTVVEFFIDKYANYKVKRLQ